MKNVEIAQILGEIGEYLQMQSVSFKPRAYQRAASTIHDLSEELEDTYARGGIKALREIPGVGQAIAEKIEELLQTGKLVYYEKLKEEMPVNLSALSSVEGLGPKRVKVLYEELGVRSIDDLEKAAKSGQIAALEGFGQKSEDNILKGIAFYRSQGGRLNLGKAAPIAEMLEGRLRSLEAVEKIKVAGSYRRRKETVGDLDILVVSKKPAEVMDFFTTQPEVARVLAKGDTKSSVTLAQGIDVDLRVVKAKSYGAALNYFTGSKAHNVELRRLAQSKGLKLNEYGLFKGEKQIAGRNEEDIYKALGLLYIEPEMRENTGEIELAGKGKLPKLIKYTDLKGDLQLQTNWTDGKNTIEEMAEKAIGMDLEYIAITDHTRNLPMTGGLDEKRLQEQAREIEKLNKQYQGKLTILRGSECDILKDGTLDLTDEALSEIDVVGVSVHSYFSLPRKAQMARLRKAFENPHSDIFFHPTARVIGKRPAIDIDMDELIDMAKETGMVLEVNGQPDRLDLKDEYVRKCVEARVPMVISSDAHSVNAMEHVKFGIAQARRGWAEKRDIINAWPLDKMLSFLKDDGKRSTE